MNAMGHDVPTLIGIDHRGLVGRIRGHIPDYMPMGERGMADMAEMEMELPANTAPMMTGQGPFGSVEMGECFQWSKSVNHSGPATTAIRAGIGIQRVLSPALLPRPRRQQQRVRQAVLPS